ncbi:hypothetical protein [Cellulosimicrobium sp. SH8]|uniref:hypothetical protein n=1 Tax=Cellulosimicrobium sp. SH8 TaxID=2952936 RepID=UPI0021F2FB69|nr:hypothetical protein [Cellulosimicrobium sp. SH8]
MTAAEHAAVRQPPRASAWPARWPTVAGIAFGAALAAAFWFGVSDTAQVAQVLTAAGFVYLGAAALGRRSAAWPLFGLTFVLLGVGFAVPGFDPSWALLALVVVVGVYGLVRGKVRPGWGLPLQAAAMAVVVGVAVAVALLGQPWAGLVVGAGLLAHAAWDVHHLRARRVVSSSLAEFCCALDAVLGVGVVVMSFAG